MPVLEDTVYFLCMLTSLACVVLLMRGWHRGGAPLLLWSALCFGLLAVNNFLLVIDVLLPHVDLRPYRATSTLAAISVLFFGLVWESD